MSECCVYISDIRGRATYRFFSSATRRRCRLISTSLKALLASAEGFSVNILFAYVFGFANGAREYRLYGCSAAFGNNKRNNVILFLSPRRPIASKAFAVAEKSSTRSDFLSFGCHEANLGEERRRNGNGYAGEKLTATEPSHRQRALHFSSDRLMIFLAASVSRKWAGLAMLRGECGPRKGPSECTLRTRRAQGDRAAAEEEKII